MKAAELVQRADAFAQWLSGTWSKPVSCSYVSSENRNFIDVYQNPLPPGAGVYFFASPEGEVFYVGKTEARRADFGRIWFHIGTAADLASGGRGFPNAWFRSKRLLPVMRDAIEKGEFQLHYLVITPPQLTSLFEVYLHTACFFSDGQLPACNAQFG
jgi:hypothetical protein